LEVCSSMFRNKLILVLTLGLLFAPFVTPAFAQGTTPPAGFCTTPPPNNPGWQIVAGTARISNPPCGVSGKYAFSRGGSVSKFTSWTAAENARGTDSVTYYYEGAVEASTAAPSGQVVMEDRISRLIRLDGVYRSQGVHAWLAAAGITCAVSIEARQPEEETVTDAQGTHVVVSGVQVRGNCDSIPYPAVLTTDRPNEVIKTDKTRQYQPDLRNASVLYTNVGLRGQGTIWVDGSNWSQLTPPNMQSAAPTSIPVQATVAATQAPPTEVPRPTNVAPKDPPPDLNALCKNLVGWQVATSELLGDPGCGTDGTWIVDINHALTRFKSFAEAEKFRNGRNATFWFEPKAPEKEPKTPTTSQGGLFPLPGWILALIAVAIVIGLILLGLLILVLVARLFSWPSSATATARPLATMRIISVTPTNGSAVAAQILTILVEYAPNLAPVLVQLVQAAPVANVNLVGLVWNYNAGISMLQATVPAGTAVGVYDVRVTFATAPVTVLTLPGAYIVTP